MISTSTGINGVRLAHHISFASTVTYLLNSAWTGIFRKKFKNFYRQLLFLGNVALRILLRTIFALLARANKRVHVHNERNFPRSKLDQIDVSFSCVCPVIDHKFGHNIVKVAVDPQTTMTMLRRNSLSIAGQTH